MCRCYRRKMTCSRVRSGGKMFFEFPFLEELALGNLYYISNDVLKTFGHYILLM